MKIICVSPYESSTAWQPPLLQLGKHMLPLRCKCELCTIDETIAAKSSWVLGLSSFDNLIKCSASALKWADRAGTAMIICRHGQS